MTLIWLSPGLPADRSSIAASLGPAVEVSSAASPPEGASVAVATVFERSLLDRLAAVPGAGTLLLLKPPGTATPWDLPVLSGPSTVVEAADVNAVVAAVQGQLAGSPAPWPAIDRLGDSAPGGWLLQRPAEAPTGELPSAEPVGLVTAGAGSRTSRRNWLASGGIIGVAALAAVVVLATQGGASNASADGRGGPAFGGRGGYGFAGGGFPGMGGTGSTGQAPSGTGQSGTGQSGTGQSGTGTDRAAERQAFLDCLKNHGVDTSTMTSGRQTRLDPSDPRMPSALKACASLMPQRGDRDGNGPPPGGGAPGMPGMSGTGGQGMPGGPFGQAPSGSGTSGGTSGTGHTT
ncbi:MAG TPA: hypothetical protein VLR26_09310 [Frankiaceae bacterium]|nr:hypothetical protein [Frankiaceae bacterium]